MIEWYDRPFKKVTIMKVILEKFNVFLKTAHINI